jgi:DNA-directed RNA polymerase specialized sigma24 family protein
MTADSKLDIQMVEGWQRTFVDLYLSRIERHAKAQFSLLRPDKKEEAIQNTCATAWKAYRDLLLKGRDPSGFISMIAEFAVRHTRAGRHIMGSEKAKDVMSFVAQNRGGFSVQEYPANDKEAVDHEALDALADTHTASPDLQAQFRMDSNAWRKSLSARDRDLLNDMIAGYTTKEIAKKYGFSAGNVSQHRRKLHTDYLVFQGEEEGRGR